jgi:hypothetical protein
MVWKHLSALFEGDILNLGFKGILQLRIRMHMCPNRYVVNFLLSFGINFLIFLVSENSVLWLLSLFLLRFNYRHSYVVIIEQIHFAFEPVKKAKIVLQHFARFF